MTLDALDERAGRRVLVERERAERDALVELHVVADHARLADDDARAVVDEEPLADRRAGVDVDARLRVGELGHDARDDRHLQPIELVRQPVDRHGVEPRIGHHDLHRARRRRVALIGGLHVRLDEALHLRQPREERADDRRRVPVGTQQLDLLLQLRRDQGRRVLRAQLAVDARVEQGQAPLHDERDSLWQCHVQRVLYQTEPPPGAETCGGRLIRTADDPRTASADAPAETRRRPLRTSPPASLPSAGAPCRRT